MSINRWDYLKIKVSSQQREFSAEKICTAWRQSLPTALRQAANIQNLQRITEIKCQGHKAAINKQANELDSFKKWDTSGQWSFLIVSHIPNHQGSTNSNYFKMPPRPSQNACIMNSSSKRCRGCGERGETFHCWLECKLVTPLWKSVWRFLKAVQLVGCGGAHP